MSLTYLLFLTTYVCVTVSQTHQLYDVDTSVLVNGTDDCLKTFNSNVTCPWFIGRLYVDPFYSFNYDKNVLEELCATSCLDSLTSHRDMVKEACSGAEYVDKFGNTRWVPWYPDESLLYALGIACLKRSDGQFCNIFLHENDTPDTACDYCMLAAAQKQVNSPFATDEGVYDNYKSLTSECKATGYPTTTVDPVLISTNIPATRTCTGTSYEVKATDDFYSVPKSQSVSTELLLHNNGLSYIKADFPKSGSLCIENKCKIHILAEDETCSSIAAAANISTVQLRAWNININSFCSNLDRFIGNTFCVSNPLGTNYTLPDSPTVTPVPTPAPIPDNIAPNVTTHCGRYYKISDGDDCAVVTTKFGISRPDFGFLNPGVDKQCTNIWLNYFYCVQPVGDITDYPGYGSGPTKTRPLFTPGPSTSIPWEDSEPTPDPNQIIIPLANLTREDCWQYIWVNDTRPESVGCWGIARAAGIDREEMILWNPSLAQNSTDEENPDYPCSLKQSMSYCVAVASHTPVLPTPIKPPTPRASGEINGCVDWFLADEEVDCESTLNNLGLTIEELYKMNPSLGMDCAGMVAGTYYCHYTGDDENDDEDPAPTTTTETPTASPTPTSPPAPGPTQPGIPENCNKWVQQMDGIYCFDMANNAGISLEQLYKLNPALGGDCTGLWVGYSYCIVTA
ncbi:uncharacterized protein GIQ15_02852 [Arthroderma uncinatum]|uniref:uncharacterized protein n=1 Tax=Arthroderma uncinatum TaxID=74035 RepID=UPI00144ABCB0|nr:uncharacterized protein GIQ15_02852 [Arthroderma uncinatum]KAF3483528.1 hypothetical protein GIQ15_02852 [Arthroderma uncinatum]